VKGELKRRVLGKGLSSLIPDAPAGDPLAAANPFLDPRREKRCRFHRCHPAQPTPTRQKFAENDIDELAESIRQERRPSTAPVPPGKERPLHADRRERRLRAARRAGLNTVPVLLKEVPTNGCLEFALIENIQRDDLNPMETGRAFRALVRDLGLTQRKWLNVSANRAAPWPISCVCSTWPPKFRTAGRGEARHGSRACLAGLADSALQIKLARQAASARCRCGKWRIASTPREPPESGTATLPRRDRMWWLPKKLYPEHSVRWWELT